MPKVEELQAQIKNIHEWLTNAIPKSLYGIDVTDHYKVTVYDAIREWLYPNADKKDSA